MGFEVFSCQSSVFSKLTSKLFEPKVGQAVPDTSAAATLVASKRLQFTPIFLKTDVNTLSGLVG